MPKNEEWKRIAAERLIDARGSHYRPTGETACRVVVERFVSIIAEEHAKADCGVGRHRTILDTEARAEDREKFRRSAFLAAFTGYRAGKHSEANEQAVARWSKNDAYAAVAEYFKDKP